MTTFSRRALVGHLALGGSVVAAQAVAAAPAVVDPAGIKKESDIACLYHCDFGDPTRIATMATNIANHLSVYDADPFKLKIVIVAHASGIKPFLTDLDGTPWAQQPVPPGLFQRFADLAKSGVEIYLCRLTFEHNKIDLAKARPDPFIRLVPSGVATVAALQAKGFAYIKVG